MSGRIIKSLVEKCSIDEDWLRTGRGDMYNKNIEETMWIYRALERDEAVRKNVIGFLRKRYGEELERGYKH